MNTWKLVFARGKLNTSKLVFPARAARGAGLDQQTGLAGSSSATSVGNLLKETLR